MEEESLKEIFEPIINYNTRRTLVSYYNYEGLHSTDIISTIYIKSSLSKEEIDNLKYLSPNKKIFIQFEENQNIELILNKLLELNKNFEIEINVNNKELFNKTNIYKNSSKYSKLNISINEPTNATSFFLEDYKRFEEILYLFIKPALEKDYSPFEKYIYAYNIAKKFKEYKESKENTSDSRNLYNILINEYMVCVGYSRMFRDLLSKLGISNIEKSVTVTTNKAGDNIFDEKGIIDEDGHARAYVHIVDPKYNIDGFYISDPTWDNDLDNDYYIYLAITNQEINYSHRAIKQNTQDMLFDSISKEDFYIRLERLIDRKISENLNITKKFEKTASVKNVNIKEIYIDIINNILGTIKVLDNQEYQNICHKFYFAINKNDPKIEEFLKNIPQILEYLCNYITSKVNKPISGKTIIDAAMVINRDIFSLTEEQANELRNHLIEINKERQAIAFPQVTIENQTTGEIFYENSQNKFDIDVTPTVHNQK